MTTILNVANNGGMMHAFIVGVGRYPYCEAAGQNAGFSDGLVRRFRPVSSPPRSALSLAEWLIKEQVHDEVAPLGSVELLVSGEPLSVLHTAEGVREIEEPTWDNVSRAFDRWYQRCDSDESNVAIFFFSGHGVRYGDQQALLLEDFGHNRLRIFDHAVSFDRTYREMQRCRAGTQCYFVDACRETPFQLLGQGPDGARSLINTTPDKGWSSRDRVCIYSAAPGELAWGLEDGVTVFTQALLDALGGSAARNHNTEGHWEVTTETLFPAIHRILDRAETPAGERQTADDDLGTPRGTSLRRLHQPPQIHFRLGCEPTQALRSARMGITHVDDHALELWRDPPVPSAWVGSTSAGIYSVNARFPNGGYRDASRAVAFLPPYVDVELRVDRV